MREFLNICAMKNVYIPKPASGFSALILSRQSWEKNIYAERARFGALGSFPPFLPFGAFSAFSAALRCRKDRRQHRQTPTRTPRGRGEGREGGVRGVWRAYTNIGRLGRLLGHLGGGEERERDVRHDARLCGGAPARPTRPRRVSGARVWARRGAPAPACAAATATAHTQRSRAGIR